MKSTEFIPVSDHVMVRPVALETGEATTETGIVTDLQQKDSIIDRPSEGVVISVGKHTEQIEAGMFVMWLDTDGKDIELEDGDFLVLKERSILGYRDE